MANAIQASFKQALQNKEIDMNTDTIRVAAIDDSYVYSAAHDFFDDVSANVLGTPVAVTGATISGGNFNCDDFTISGIAASDVVQGFWFYHWTGVAGTSKLAVWIDTTTGLPLTSTGNNLDVTIHASGLYDL